MITIRPMHHLDRAISYGESCFETVAAINGSIFDWPRHLYRLSTGCAQLGIALDHDDHTNLTTAAHDCIADEDRIIRLTVTPGAAKWGITASGDGPHLFIQYQARTPRPPPQLISMEHPYGDRIIEAKFSSDYGTMLRLGGRNILQQSAMPLLWHHDRLCCAATANIALHVGLLPGIIRHHLLASGLLHAQCCDRSMLSRCDAIALLNSGGLVQEAVSIDERALTHCGAATALQQALNSMMQPGQL